MGLLLAAGSGGVDVTVTPSTGALTLTGFAASISASSSVEPGLGTLTLAAFAPTVTVSFTATPGLGALTLTGLSATLTASSSATPGVGSLTISGLAPTVETGVTATPGVGSLTISGFAASVVASSAVTPDVGTLTITGFAPTVSATSGAVDATVTPDPGALVITGFAPTVSATATSSLRGRLIRREGWKRRLQVDSEFTDIEPPVEPELILEPPAPIRVTKGLLQRVSAAKESEQIEVLLELTNKAAEAENRRSIERLNKVLEVVGRKAREREQLAELRRDLIARADALRKEEEDEDEMLLLFAA